MADQLSISNNALGEIAADPIDSLEEASLSARECSRVFRSVFREALTWAVFDFSIRRVVLALQANDRGAEWGCRYAKPADMAEPIRIRPNLPDASGNFPIVGPYTFPAIDALGPMPFVVAGGSIYTNVEEAILEYRRTDVPIADVDPATARAIELEMAVRLAYPVKKNREIKGDLIKQAEVARQRAIADNENRSPRASISYVSPVEYARDGLMDV